MANWLLLNKYKLAVIPVILFVVFVSLLVLKPENDQENKLFANGTFFNFELADSQEEREQGLSGRQALDNDDVLVFVFPNSDKHGIWMKDMNFPIDIIWLDDQKQVVDFEVNVSPDTYPTIFYPDKESSYVVETNAGISESVNLSVGDTFEF